MRKVSEVLKEERLKRGFSLDEVQRQTKIRKSVLESLENGDYDNLPPTTFIKGFIRNYGDFLGLDINELLALFRREYDERKNSTPLSKRYTPAKFVLTPTVIIGLIVVLVVVLFVGYLYREYQSFAAPPFLVLDEPQDNLKINKETVSVVGRTDADAELKINGQKINLGPGGTFAQEVSISEGTNSLIITSTNKLGKITTLNRRVLVELPKPPPSVPAASASANIEN